VSGDITDDKKQERVEYVLSLPPAAERDDIDLSSILAGLFRRKRLIIVCATIFVILSTIAALVSPQKYESSVIAAPVSTESSANISEVLGGLSGFAALAGIDLQNQSDDKQQWLALLKSRSFTEEFIQRESLPPIFFEDEWDSESGDWKSNDPDDQPTTGDAYEIFDEEIRFVTEDVNTGLITLTIRWHDRELAADWANKLIDQVNNHIRHRDIDEAERTIEYLREQLAKTTIVEIKQGLYGLLEGQIQRIVVANVREDYAFQVIDHAFVSDADEYVWPSLPVFVALGLVIGIFVGSIIALFLEGKTIFRVDES